MSDYNFLVLGFVIVGLLFVSPSIIHIVPTAEAAHEVPHAITDLSQPIPSGTVIEYDLNWNSISPSGDWYSLTSFIDNHNYNENQTYLNQFDQNANCIDAGGYCFQVELIKEGELASHNAGKSFGFGVLSSDNSNVSSLQHLK